MRILSLALAAMLVLGTQPMNGSAQRPRDAHASTARRGGSGVTRTDEDGNLPCCRGGVWTRMPAACTASRADDLRSTRGGTQRAGAVIKL